MTTKLDRLHLVLTFLAVAQHGNLSAAAKALGTTQPTVSRRLRDLEVLLGTRLAARTTHRFHLTPEGIELQRRAMVWSDEWSEWEHDLKTTTSVPRGVLTIVGPHAYGNSFLMEAIGQYRATYPQVQVRLRLTDGAVDLIKEGADLWVCAGGSQDQTLHVRRLGLMRRILIASKDYPGRTIRQPEHLKDHPLIGLIPLVYDRLVLRSVRTEERREVRMQSAVATDGLLSSYRGIQLGMGIGASAFWLCGPDLASGAVKRILPSWELEPVPIEVVTVAGRFRPARIDAFVEILSRLMANTKGFEPSS
ncbi:LysR family transcriptional regulator [Ottowia thiooxydans]|uniref:LysR family transcriptional regulator n=1 Tax=Ottowia thiooxydans TaxID=219182 RepID=UPI0004916164|nr:LysR family transcriptional regulator [Ottowia thiooxydans]